VTSEEEHVAAGHHWHVRGNWFECSCGTPGGVFTIAIDEDFDYEAYLASISCSICGEPGVTAADEPGGEG
jgi:hypothetical protein